MKSIAIVVPEMFPRGGIAEAVCALSRSLSNDYLVKIYVIKGEIPSSASRIYGIQKLYSARKLGIRVMNKSLFGNDCVILAGIWSYIRFTHKVSIWRKVIVWEHSLCAERAKVDSKLKILLTMIRYCLSRARYVVAVSESVNIFLRTLLRPSNQLRVISNLVSIPTEKSKKTMFHHHAKHLVLWVGNSRKIKNLDLALEVMTFLPQNYKLQIVGVNKFSSKQSRLVKAITHSELIRFTLDKESPFEGGGCMFDYLLITSKSETFSYVAYEALLRGITVVAPPIHCFRNPPFQSRGLKIYLNQNARSIAKFIQKTKPEDCKLLASQTSQQVSLLNAKSEKEWKKLLNEFFDKHEQ